MQKNILTLLLLFSSIIILPQNGFQLHSKKNKTVIPFQLINNLIIIPVNINGVNLNFLLDTGVENTILFSLEDTETVDFKNVEKIKIRGLGTGEPIEALRSKNNILTLKNFIDNDHEIYIILDQEVNFSSQLGIPVHGIIGYHFFKNHIVELNYKTKRVIVYQNLSDFSRKKLTKFTEIPISIDLEKPYLTVQSNLNNKKIDTKLLIDSGNSDAVWLFENDEIKTPQLFFDDFLGRGFSGDIYGKRSRIESIQIGEIKINYPTTSFPKKESLEGIGLVKGRNGSIGSGILKRFHVLFDYRNQKMYIKKNTSFDDPFNYNMSGLEIQHNGLEYVSEKVELATSIKNNGIEISTDLPTRFKYQFVLKPVYIVSNVRENSPASLAGLLKEDVITKIDNNNAYRYSLNEITTLLQSEEGKWISIEYKRKGKLYKTKFQLKKIL